VSKSAQHPSLKYLKIDVQFNAQEASSPQTENVTLAPQDALTALITRPVMLASQAKCAICTVKIRSMTMMDLKDA
jgi:hypothetical protein